jgi:cytoskeletal protein CcmA (bactofilin family)
MNREFPLKGKTCTKTLTKMEYSRIPTIRIAGSGKATIPGFGDIKISGSGHISPEKITASGSSHLPGGLIVGSLKTSGSTKIEGDIEAETVRISGSAQIDGDLTCEELKKSGSLRIEKSLKTKYGKVSGSTNIKGDTFIERELESSGAISVGGNLTSEERILYSGVMNVDGYVKAKSFEARLGSHKSQVRDGIEADYINIQRSHDDWRNRGYLITKDISGEDILLENVECENLTGKNIRILQGCKISGKIKYSDSLTVDPDSYLENEPEKIER